MRVATKTYANPSNDHSVAYSLIRTKLIAEIKGLLTMTDDPERPPMIIEDATEVHHSGVSGANGRCSG